MLRPVLLKEPVLNDPSLVYEPVLLLDMDNLTIGGGGALSVLHSLVRFRTYTDALNGITIHVATTGVDEHGEYAVVVITR